MEYSILRTIILHRMLSWKKVFLLVIRLEYFPVIYHMKVEDDSPLSVY